MNQLEQLGFNHMNNVLDILKERGFIEQTTHDAELRDYLGSNQISCYIGFDPTASSLHVGSLVPIMSLAHMQKSGHRPIALVGGGTGLVGDPSGKTETRKLLTLEQVEENVIGIKKQLARYLDFENDKAILLNNADWLTELKYIPFLRDIGKHFSVNRMIKSESYRMRLEAEDGLNFIEFNYMLLQAYDFLELLNRTNCRLQMGGSDQWGNIVAGIELIRRLKQQQAFGITFPLITTSTGAKMGKTAKGAVWLDSNRTSPYDYYQFWVNTEDADVTRFLSLFTFLPMDEIEKTKVLKDVDLNCAKSVLAYEATALAHGHDEAVKAYRASAGIFGFRVIAENILPSSGIPRKDENADDQSMPHTFMRTAELQNGIPFFKLLNMVGLASSGGAARRLIDQGGAYVNGNRIESGDFMVTEKDIINNEILLSAGKKRFHKLKFQN
jgi:tyrosyl-tRNA synthetase